MTKEMRQLKIQPVTATPREEVVQHVAEHLKLIDKWIDKAKIDMRLNAHICSGGPSLEKYISQVEEIKEGHPDKEFNKIWCVKHALPRLKAIGITPDYCVILDGRPFNEHSTHGELRSDLIKSASKDTVFFVASMTHPDYTHYLLENGYTVIGWHCLTDGLKDFGNVVKYAVAGGTSSCVRTVGVAHTLGFRRGTIYGADSSLKERMPKGKAPKEYFEAWVGLDANRVGPIPTTGELAAQSLDIERAIIDEGQDFELDVKCDGLVGEIIKQRVNVTKKRPYQEILGIK